MFLKIPPLPIQLVAIIALVICFGHFVPHHVIELLYTFSMIFKEFLSALLPFMVFSFILSGILSFKKNAPIVLGVVLLVATASNFIAAMFSFSIGRFILHELIGGLDQKALQVTESVHSLVAFKIPTLVKPEYAMLGAVVMGIFFSFFQVPQVGQFAKTMKAFVERVLNGLFIPVLPFYVMGFLLKLQYEGSFGMLFSSFGKAFSVVLVLHVLYLTAVYIVGAGFSVVGGLRAIKNAMPSYLTGFSTMSGAVSLPVSIQCAEVNTQNRPVADISMPIMANICLTGDALTVPIFTLVSMGIFLGYTPSLMQCFIFVGYFCVALLATSGVPGGGILTLLPVLRSIFGFTPGMESIMMTLYLLQDSFGTAANVMGDGGLVMIIDKLLKRVGIRNS